MQEQEGRGNNKNRRNKKSFLNSYKSYKNPLRSEIQEQNRIQKKNERLEELARQKEYSMAAKTARDWTDHKYIEKYVNGKGKTVYVYPDFIEKYANRKGQNVNVSPETKRAFTNAYNESQRKYGASRPVKNYEESVAGPFGKSYSKEFNEYSGERSNHNRQTGVTYNVGARHLNERNLNSDTRQKNTLNGYDGSGPARNLGTRRMADLKDPFESIDNISNSIRSSNRNRKKEEEERQKRIQSQKNRMGQIAKRKARKAMRERQEANQRLEERRQQSLREETQKRLDMNEFLKNQAASNYTYKKETDFDRLKLKGQEIIGNILASTTKEKELLNKLGLNGYLKYKKGALEGKSPTLRKANQAVKGTIRRTKKKAKKTYDNAAAKLKDIFNK